MDYLSSRKGKDVNLEKVYRRSTEMHSIIVFNVATNSVKIFRDCNIIIATHRKQILKDNVQYLVPRGCHVAHPEERIHNTEAIWDHKMILCVAPHCTRILSPQWFGSAAFRVHVILREKFTICSFSFTTFSSVCSKNIGTGWSAATSCTSTSVSVQSSHTAKLCFGFLFSC